MSLPFDLSTSFAGHPLSIWLIFHVIVFGLLALDLGVLNRKAHVIKVKEALLWSVFWIIIGLSFGAYIWQIEGSKAGLEYITGYLVEKSLSVDNLFVFLIIFESMKIERKHQHKLLFWGIMGAIILRAIMITIGAQILMRFEGVIVLFGAFLIYTGIKIFTSGDEAMDPQKNPIFKLARKHLPLTLQESHGHFMIKDPQTKKRLFTTSFLALILIETSDVIFALDSVPAVFGITRDPFIVYTSNIFAILGLRSLFFVLEELLYKFHFLKIGLGVVLCYVGTKMCVEHWFHVGPVQNLLVIGGILSASILASLLIPRKDPKSQ